MVAPMMVRIPPLLAVSLPDECAALAARQLQARILYRRRFEFLADSVQPRLTPLRAKGYSRNPR